MAKASTKKEQQGDTRYLFIYKWELESAAYRALTGDEVKVYQDIRVRYNGRNNGAIKYSTRRAAEVLNKHNATGARALTRLIELKFLKVRQESTFGQKRLSREFEITAIKRGKASSRTKLDEGTCDFMKLTSEAIQEIDQEKAVGSKRKNAKHSRMGADA